MNYLSRAINAAKDGYLYVIEGVVSHPHITVWVAVGLIVLAKVS